jgi:hypothetical protein
VGIDGLRVIRSRAETALSPAAAKPFAFGAIESGVDLERKLQHLNLFYKTLFALRAANLEPEESATALGLSLASYYRYWGRLAGYLREAMDPTREVAPLLPAPPARFLTRVTEEE